MLDDVPHGDDVECLVVEMDRLERAVPNVQPLLARTLATF
jgi:hypothetical protein